MLVAPERRTIGDAILKLLRCHDPYVQLHEECDDVIVSATVYGVHARVQRWGDRCAVFACDDRVMLVFDAVSDGAWSEREIAAAMCIVAKNAVPCDAFFYHQYYYYYHDEPYHYQQQQHAGHLAR